MNYKEKGKLITKSRQKKGLTQAKLAEKLYITDKAVSRWETGLGMPDVSLLPSLCDILDITISGLLEENIDKTNIETEIKIKMSENEFNDFNALIEKNSVFIKQINQVDEYFTPSHRDFTKEKYPYEWISIRQRGNKNIINYKHWYPENELKSTHCDELEVEIDDVENMNKIFNVLGLKSFANIIKERTTYLYNDKYEIAFDKVKDLGYFIEVEVKKYDKDPILEYEDLLKLACLWNLNLNNIDRRGYPYYYINK